MKWQVFLAAYGLLFAVLLLALGMYEMFTTAADDPVHLVFLLLYSVVMVGGIVSIVRYLMRARDAG